MKTFAQFIIESGILPGSKPAKAGRRFDLSPIKPKAKSGPSSGKMYGKDFAPAIKHQNKVYIGNAGKDWHDDIIARHWNKLEEPFNKDPDSVKMGVYHRPTRTFHDQDSIKVRGGLSKNIPYKTDSLHLNHLPRAQVQPIAKGDKQVSMRSPSKKRVRFYNGGAGWGILMK